MPQHWVRTFQRYVLAGLLLLILVLLPRAESAEVNVKFEQANRLYEQGKYGEAANAYESIVKSRGGSTALYFNLGNAYFKDGQLGRALFHYRMAERMAPRDPDIEANLRLTRERVAGASPASSSTRTSDGRWLSTTHAASPNSVLPTGRPRTRSATTSSR